jgi:hypothetical protein
VNTFEPHLEVLPAAQRALWPLLSPTIELGFVLYGGTAIALRLGHRASVDFDFFTERPPDRDALFLRLPFLAQSRTLQDTSNTFTALASTNAGAVKLSFFWDIGFGRAGSPAKTSDGVLEIASPLDLLATKLKVVQQRIESRDYLDIIALLHSGTSLEDALAAASIMYGPSFQPSEALKALGYFEGGDLALLTDAHKKFLSVAIASVRHIPVATGLTRRLSAGS